MGTHLKRLLIRNASASAINRCFYGETRKMIPALSSNTPLSKVLCNRFSLYIIFVFFQRDCPDGLLSKAKFLEVYSTFFPAGNPDQFCEHVFRSFDKDNSGKIDFKEFLLAINITSGGNPSQKLNWAFAMYDIDGNGTIEKNEMVEIIKVSKIIVIAVNMLIFMVELFLLYLCLHQSKLSQNMITL